MRKIAQGVCGSLRLHTHSPARPGNAMTIDRRAQGAGQEILEWNDSGKDKGKKSEEVFLQPFSPSKIRSGIYRRSLPHLEKWGWGKVGEWGCPSTPTTTFLLKVGVVGVDPQALCGGGGQTGGPTTTKGCSFPFSFFFLTTTSAPLAFHIFSIPLIRARSHLSSTSSPSACATATPTQSFA